MTPGLLRDAIGCSAELADLYAPHLAEACARLRVDPPDRLAAFLAQIGHESGSLQYVREIWGPTAAQARYEGRTDLGNTEPGDGFRYRGRGLIQCTGRDNYRRMTRWLAPLNPPDFEAAPEQLEEPKWAAWSAAAWWANNGCNELADKGDFDALTRRINGGLNGIEDRRKRWERAKAALRTQTPEPEKTMPLAPIAAAVLPSIISAIPKLGKLFGSGSEVADRNIKAAEMVVDVVTQATGAVNAQQAAERLASDPAAVQAATKAVDSIWYELSEAGGGGIEGARKANEAYADPAGPKFWLNPAFWISLILLSMPMMLLVDVFYVHPDKYTGEIRTQIVTGVLMVISMVGAYWIGTSFSSARKTELASKG